MSLKYLVIFLVWIICHSTKAQNEADTLMGRNLYRPATAASNHPTPIDTLKTQSALTDHETGSDTSTVNLDSLFAREAFVRDSILLREAFVRDSILVREAFVRDSLLRRQQIRDSLRFLQTTLPKYAKATLASYSDQVIIGYSPIRIIGDSCLSAFHATNLPLGFNKPFTPWKEIIQLTSADVEIDADTLGGVINRLKSGDYELTFQNHTPHIIVVSGKRRILRRQNEQLYKTPIDSIILNRAGQFVIIKRYTMYNKMGANYAVGEKMFDYLWQTKEYTYSPSGSVTGYQIINYCDRRKVTDAVKTCNAEKYEISFLGDHYQVARKHQPANPHSDGTFQYYFNTNEVLEKVSFKNEMGSESWTTFIETNEEGNVSRYVYQNNGKVSQTLLINYYLDNPKAKYPVETISCMFEDDGVSYHQVNNTTGKMRTRERMTMEWSPWK